MHKTCNRARGTVMRCRWSWLTKLTLLVTIAVQLRAPPLVGASSGVEMFLQSVSDGGNSASDGPLEVPLRVDLATVSPGWGDLGLLRAATGICPADGSCAMCDFVDENPCQVRGWVRAARAGPIVSNVG